ncbi:hypothetical protein [Bradyrhizobium ottawaense]|uniref:hypothetical protein n=1 Tax=Bradyrhizobium ottawaense TaxID=931866 RepID=UPI0036F376AA
MAVGHDNSGIDQPACPREWRTARKVHEVDAADPVDQAFRNRATLLRQFEQRLCLDTDKRHILKIETGFSISLDEKKTGLSSDTIVSRSAIGLRVKRSITSRGLGGASSRFAVSRPALSLIRLAMLCAASGLRASNRLTNSIRSLRWDLSAIVRAPRLLENDYGVAGELVAGQATRAGKSCLIF